MGVCNNQNGAWKMNVKCNRFVGFELKSSCVSD